MALTFGGTAISASREQMQSFQELPDKTTGMKESDLYLPLKRLLESQHYEVKGEVQDCDVLAVRGEEAPVAIELKVSLKLEVILQASESSAGGWVTQEDGTCAAVTTFNLSEASASGEANPTYAAQLRAVLERLAFPSDYIRSIG